MLPDNDDNDGQLLRYPIRPPPASYVLPDFLSETSGKMFRQLRTGLIKNHLRGIGTETFLYNGNSYKIKMISKCLIHFKKEASRLLRNSGTP